MSEAEYKALLRRSNIPFPMKGIEREIYLAVLVSLAAGIVISLVRDSWGWLSGSGSLIVVIGIYLAWRDFVSTVGDVRKLYSEIAQELLQHLDESPAKSGGIISQVMEQGEKRRELEARRDRGIGLCDAFRLRLRTTEAVILGAGTLISGFGSLLPTSLLSAL